MSNEHPGAERAVVAYGSAVRTALRNNATAYGFSISVTATFSLAMTAYGSAPVLPTFLFAVGAVVAFMAVGVAMSRFSASREPEESDRVVLISGAVDLLSVLAAVGTAAGLSKLVPGVVMWPVTAFGATAAYLLVGGIDVLIARRTAQEA